MADMRGQLILINGHGGAGKYTNAELLHTQLDGSAWIHMRWLLRIRSWGPTDEYAELGNSNAAAVINNYLEFGARRIIYSGNVTTQQDLDGLLTMIEYPCRTAYFWLHAERDVRYARVRRRNRDEGDRPPFVDEIFQLPTDEPELCVEAGVCHRIDTSRKSPHTIVAEMLGFVL